MILGHLTFDLMTDLRHILRRIGQAPDVDVAVLGSYDGLHGGGELKTMVEERRFDEWQTNEVFHRQRPTQQLPALHG